jgi:serine/threonine protein kinase
MKSSLTKEYSVISELGEGSFGSVYLVEDEKGKKYALKKISIN